MTIADGRIDDRFERFAAPGVRASVMRRTPDDPSRATGPDSPPESFRVDRARLVPPSRVEAALARILASSVFRHSARHRAFLRYVVEAALAGRARCLKEVVIGLDVFDRDLDGYDPRRDSIVRVEARRLRHKLQQYYDGEGRRDPVEIRLDAGSYVPQFDVRSAPAVLRASSLLVLVAPFVVIGSGHAESKLAVGLADQLVDRLGAIGGVQVMAPLVAARLLDDAIAIDALRRTHGVDYIVDGSVTTAGSRLRCAVRLSATSDGTRRWSNVLDFDEARDDDGAVPDLFAFQDRIAAEAAAACSALRRESVATT